MMLGCRRVLVCKSAVRQTKNRPTQGLLLPQMMKKTRAAPTAQMTAVATAIVLLWASSLTSASMALDDDNGKASINIRGLPYMRSTRFLDFLPLPLSAKSILFVIKFWIFFYPPPPFCSDVIYGSTLILLIGHFVVYAIYCENIWVQA